ncbi:hypothetical protein FRC14_005742 [Serendipita sp. 396]|nr:hypothetical protein FRC14_005742 [Serendipita sp. 396]KAG8780322.1 hypothetical protein FRC15_009624 [Serendipita sp. 397]
MLSIEERSRASAKKENASLKRWMENPLNDDLILIRKQVPNVALGDLFAQTVKHLATKSHKWKNPLRFRLDHSIRVLAELTLHRLSKETDQINLQAIVWRVKEQIGQAPIGDERHPVCCTILQEAMGDLKKALAKQRRKDELEEKEKKAILDDRRRYDRVRQSTPRPSSNLNTELKMIFIRDPREPEKEPYILKQDRLMITYKDLIWRLRVDKIAQFLHLWARSVNPGIRGYAACPGLQWIHVVGNYPIEGREFGVVDLDKVSDSYIVALVDKNGNEDIPRPIDVPLFGKKTCCEPACNSLMTHLQSIWKDSTIMNARMLPDDRCVRQTPFDSENFPPLRNDLYLEVSEPEKGAHAPIVVESSNQSPAPSSSKTR